MTQSTSAYEAIADVHVLELETDDDDDPEELDSFDFRVELPDVLKNQYADVVGVEAAENENTKAPPFEYRESEHIRRLQRATCCTRRR